MTSSLPVLFLSHGSPMLAVEVSPAVLAWAEQARELPLPKAILMVSAHWESGLPLLGGAVQPETIHDFGGFPKSLYDIRYPAPGAPDVAQAALALLRDAGLQAGIEGCRGLDHGAWVPLLRMYPKADVPVLQLSIQPELGAAHHFTLGRALQPLREQGVLIIGSGHMTHNLRDWMASPDSASPWEYAAAFRNWVYARVQAGDMTALVDWETLAPFAARAHPTSEHFMPLFVALGAAGHDIRSVVPIHDGYDHGVLAMDAYRFG